MDKRVVGCATAASQTAETEGIRRLLPRPILLLHGTGDRTLSQACSERLYAMYGGKGNRRIKLFEGDNHALSQNAETAETMICDFIANYTGLHIDKSDRDVILEEFLVDDKEREALMRKGGDIEGAESVQWTARTNSEVLLVLLSNKQSLSQSQGSLGSFKFMLATVNQWDSVSGPQGLGG